MNSETFKLSKLRNIALAGILAAGVVGPTYVASTAHADDTAAQATQEQTDQSQQSSDDSNSFVKDLLGSTDTTDQDANDPTKTETVYVFNNADGSARNAIVTDWLKNVKGDQSLSDVSNLTDIENTESQAGYQQDGQNLTWDAQGNDIYYKGNTADQAPVSIKVTYWLDGQEISPDDLAGKSGHVKIRYDYTNNASYQTEVNGEQRTMYTPFVAATGLILDNGTFKNVTAVNGKIVNDGDRTTVAGFAMPGLQEDLGITTDDVEIPTYFELEADVTDFSLDTSLTAVSSNLFDNVNTDDMSEDTIGDEPAHRRIEQPLRRTHPAGRRRRPARRRLGHAAGQHRFPARFGRRPELRRPAGSFRCRPAGRRVGYARKRHRPARVGRFPAPGRRGQALQRQRCRECRSRSAEER